MPNSIAYEQITEDMLPPLAADIKDKCGLDTVIKLLSAYPGKRIYVPVGPVQEQHPLSELLGFHAANVFCDNFGGSRVDIPRCTSFICKVRDRKIQQEHAQGARIDVLAMRYGLTYRRMLSIIHKPL